MAKFSDLVQRAVFEMETKGVQRVTNELNANTRSIEQNSLAAEFNARATVTQEKSLARAEGRLISMKRASDQLFKAQQDFNKAQSLITKKGFIDESDIRLLQTLQDRITKVTGAVNDNAAAFRNLTDSMAKAAKMSAVMSQSGGMSDATGMTSKLTAALKAEQEKINSARLANFTGRMSQPNGVTDLTNMTARMSAVTRAEQAAIAAAAQERAAGMTAAMSKFGGQSAFTKQLDEYLKAEPLRKATIETKKLTDAMEANALAGKNMAAGMSLVGKKALEDSEFIRKMTGATATNTSTGLTKMQKLTVQQTLGDVISSLATGASPQTILLQQGEQFLQPFGQGMEGIKNAASKLGPLLFRMVLNPITAIAAAAGTATYAMYRWQTQTDALTVSLNGLGRASGLSVGDINQIAMKASGMSVSAARGIAGQYVGAGVSGGAIGGAVDLTKDFSKKLGMSLDDAAKTLAESLSDPARGAEELARKFGLVSRAQRDEINKLADLGDRSAATTKLVDVLNERMKGLEDPTWSASRALDGLKVSVSNLLDRIARGILGTGVQDNEFARQARQQQVLNGKFEEALARQSGLDQIAANASLAAKEITAQTFAQREAVVQEKGRIKALQDTKNATQHLMEAEAARLLLLAEAQKKIDDYVLAGQRERAIAGARTPYERGIQQIMQEGKDLLNQIPSTISAPGRPSPAAELAPGGASSGTQELLAEAVRRGMEPTEQTFQKLIDEGVGSGKFKGRFVNLNEGMTQTTVDVPNPNRAAMENQARAETAARLRAYAQNQQADFTFRVNQDLEAQNRLLDANTATLGKSTEEIERARKAAELLNQAKQQGLPLTADLNQKIMEEAAAYGDLARRTEEAAKKQQELVDALDLVRSTAKDIGESLVNAFRRGEHAADALRGVLDRLTSKLLDKTLDSALSGLLGKAGTASTGTGIFGTIASGIGSLFGFANGGIMTSAGMVPLHAYAAGGVANSPQMALFGEGRRPEAFVPLPDGRAIPVKMQGQQAKSGGAKITINNMAGADVQARETSTGEILITVQKMIEANNKKVPGIVANSQRRAM